MEEVFLAKTTTVLTATATLNILVKTKIMARKKKIFKTMDSTIKNRTVTVNHSVICWTITQPHHLITAVILTHDQVSHHILGRPYIHHYPIPHHHDLNSHLTVSHRAITNTAMTVVNTNIQVMVICRTIIRIMPKLMDTKIRITLHQAILIIIFLNLNQFIILQHQHQHQHQHQ